MLKIVKRHVIKKKPERLKRTLSVHDFYHKRNKILVIRGYGGLGDILMHRMLFEDFKLLMPDVEIHFACPKYYHDALIDHPFLDKILDLGEMNQHEYVISYNTTTACGRHELKIAPKADLNRSDIWAKHCGINLTKHNMHIQLSPKEIEIGTDIIERNRDRKGPIVALAPISAMQHKNLNPTLILETVNGLRDRGCYVFALHHDPIQCVLSNDIPMINESKIRNWMSIINQSDAIISVDTSSFHCAGGLKKPVVGIFTFANSDAYGRHYDTKELVQGPCPLNYRGCYDWGECPGKKDPILPCCANLKSTEILEAFDKLSLRFPQIQSRWSLNR